VAGGVARRMCAVAGGPLVVGTLCRRRGRMYVGSAHRDDVRRRQARCSGRPARHASRTAHRRHHRRQEPHHHWHQDGRPGRLCDSVGISRLPN